MFFNIFLHIINLYNISKVNDLMDYLKYFFLKYDICETFVCIFNIRFNFRFNILSSIYGFHIWKIKCNTCNMEKNKLILR